MREARGLCVSWHICFCRVREAHTSLGARTMTCIMTYTLKRKVLVILIVSYSSQSPVNLSVCVVAIHPYQSAHVIVLQRASITSVVSLYPP